MIKIRLKRESKKKVYRQMDNKQLKTRKKLSDLFVK